MKFMKWLQTAASIRAGRNDARRSVYDPENYLISVLGARLEWVPANSDAHRVLLADLAPLDLRDLHEDVRHAEERVVEHWHPLVIVVGMILLFVTECLSSIHLVNRLGFEGPVERVVFGIALAAGLTCLVHLIFSSRESLLVRVGWTSALVVVGVAIAVARASMLTGDTDPPSWTLSAGVIVLMLTLAPAVFIPMLVTSLVLSTRSRRALKSARRSLRLRRRDQLNARASVMNHSHQQSRWDADAARIRSAYDLGHKREAALQTGRSANAQSSNSRPSDHLV